MLLVVPMVILLVGTAVPAWRGDRAAAVLLVLVGAMWLYVDKWFEGPILIRFGHDHALVLADLVGLSAPFAAVVCVLRSRTSDRAGRQ